MAGNTFDGPCLRPGGKGHHAIYLHAFSMRIKEVLRTPFNNSCMGIYFHKEK